MPDRRPLCIVLLVLASAIWTLAGCSDGKGRQARQNLLNAADEANRRAMAALTLMANPYYRDASTGKNAPFDSVLAADPAKAPAEVVKRIDVRPQGEVNPDALAALNEAQSILNKALQEYGAVEEAKVEKALAQQQLANIIKLQGQFHSANFQHSSRLARKALTQSQQAIDDAVLQSAAAQGFAELGKGQLKDLDALKAKLEARKEALIGGSPDVDVTTTPSAAGKTKLQADIAKAQAELKDLVITSEAEKASVSNLSAEATTMSGDAAMERYDAAAVANENAKNAMVQMQKLENQIEADNATLAGVNLNLSVVEEQIALVKQLSDNRQEALSAIAKAADTADKSRQEAAQQFDAAITALANALDNGQKAYDEGAKAYQEAGVLLQKAGSSEKTSQNYAEQGNVKMDLGNLMLQNANLQAAVAAVLKQAEDNASAMDSKAPQAIKVADVNKLKADAVTNFKAAAGDYENAANRLPPRTRGQTSWVYQGAQGAAWLSAAKVSGDSADLIKAQTLLKQARENKQFSPNLDEVNKLANRAGLQD